MCVNLSFRGQLQCPKPMDKEKFGRKSQKSSAKLSVPSICMPSSQLLIPLNPWNLAFWLSGLLSLQLLCFQCDKRQVNHGATSALCSFCYISEHFRFFSCCTLPQTQFNLRFPNPAPPRKKKHTHNYKDQIPKTSWMKTRRCDLVWLQGGMPHWGLLVLHVSDINLEEAKIKRFLSLSCFLVDMHP